jgi:TonB family protein
MPEIVHFENAPYPAEAEKAGLQGNVVLKLTVDKEGNVTAADVVEPAGHGFDEAAQAAALKFKFKPATRDGVPFAVKIKYSYAFTLKVVEAPPPPPPTHGEVDGKLFIAGTDAPLAGAEVVLVSPTARAARHDRRHGGFKLPSSCPASTRSRSTPPASIRSRATKSRGRRSHRREVPRRAGVGRARNHGQG